MAEDFDINDLVWISGGIWKTSSIEQTPEIVLSRWTIRELPNGDRHFVGWNSTEGEGRVSSKIVEWDDTTLRGKTQSGRVYQLREDDMAINMDAEYVWGRWCSINSVTDYKIVRFKEYQDDLES